MNKKEKQMYEKKLAKQMKSQIKQKSKWLIKQRKQDYK